MSYKYDPILMMNVPVKAEDASPEFMDIVEYIGSRSNVFANYTESVARNEITKKFPNVSPDVVEKAIYRWKTGKVKGACSTETKDASLGSVEADECPEGMTCDATVAEQSAQEIKEYLLKQFNKDPHRLPTDSAFIQKAAMRYSKNPNWKKGFDMFLNERKKNRDSLDTAISTCDVDYKNINKPAKVSVLNNVRVKCPNCGYSFTFAARCPECGQLIDYGLNRSYYIG